MGSGAEAPRCKQSSISASFGETSREADCDWAGVLLRQIELPLRVLQLPPSSPHIGRVLNHGRGI
jgi:hypothetical protein